ncbi:fructose 1,6-bisphosphatase [Methyloceanibacter superfactus]|uniref:Fructose-1,6-bisphosphatase n=1 Tax=Methyloceanibacter superfactus TaxID=1774969 RepID=A0A1E3VPI1_9HYPH|nr:class II fructose-bisphosphatase [Methyloceanibacter superfactus]ODR95429.1 fructose 1,6-bisphosphatase [Methyloceanibacter superfactus]
MSEATARTELDRALALDIVRVTEATAVAAARWRGRGDEAAADEAAAAAMYREIARLPIEGVVVVGEGDEDESPILYNGETIGAGSSEGVTLDLAVDPVEGATLCAKALPNALSVLAVAERGSFLKVPVIYMEKIAIGPGYPDNLVDLDATPAENLEALAKAKGCQVSELTVCILDRPRHGKLIEEVRAAGAALRLISDGDIAGVVHVTEPRETGIDIYMGIGGAPEGVLAAATLACIGGQMQGRLVALNQEHRARARAAGIADLDRKYAITDMVSGDLSFAATGITDGSLLEGVRFTKDAVFTHSVVMRASTRTVRWIRTEHPDVGKFD